jgi:hypothetical protein
LPPCPRAWAFAFAGDDKHIELHAGDVTFRSGRPCAAPAWRWPCRRIPASPARI